MTDSESSADDERSFAQVLLRYEELVDRQGEVDQERFIGEHPEHESRLREYFTEAELATLAIQEETRGNQRTDWASSIGERIGGYELLELIGAGGMGVVYKAKHPDSGRIVALKTLPLDRASAERGRRFDVETSALEGIRHENVVSMLHCGNHQGRPFYVMEYMRGGDLEERLQTAAMPSGEAAEVIHKLALAVDYLHAQGIWHRDLKPSNVLFASKDPGSPPHVADFGLVKLTQTDRGSLRGLTRTGDPVGTPEYMAPEQANGEAASIGGHTDTYALGVILYRILANRPPFVGGNPLEVLRRVREHELVAPSVHNPELPPCEQLEAICLKCLERSPSERYGSPRELAEDLERWQAGQDPHALLERRAAERAREETERLERTTATRLHRRKLLKRGAAAAALTLVSGYALTRLVGGGGTDDETQPNQTLPDLPKGVYSDTDWRVSLGGRAALSVDGQPVSLVQLGTSENGAFDLELRLEVDPSGESWKSHSSAGIFFGYHILEDKTENRILYQTIGLTSEEGCLLLRHVNWGIGLARPMNASGSSIGVSWVDVQSNGTNLLRVKSSGHGRPEAFWNGTLAHWEETLPSRPTNGRFGVHGYHTPATFHDLKLNELELDLSLSSG